MIEAPIPGDPQWWKDHWMRKADALYHNLLNEQRNTDVHVGDIVRIVDVWRLNSDEAELFMDDEELQASLPSAILIELLLSIHYDITNGGQE